MYGKGTVEYHFGRAGSALATYTWAFSQATCHFSAMAFRSGPFGRASALAPGRRDARRDGAPRGFLVPRRGADGRRRTGRLRARLGFARRRLCRSRAGRVRAFFLRAIRGDRRDLRKAFRGAQAPSATRTSASRKASYIWHTG